jgi:peptidoglycan/LPS O-acetylase OafA/YrhL
MQMPDQTPTTDRYYRPELDALRFLAFGCVFMFHRMDYVPVHAATNPWLFDLSTAGAFGVPVFFLLSAFLITELFTKELARSGRIDIPAFYARRVLRIWPLYFFAFYGLALLTRFLPGVGPTTVSSWLWFSLFSGNWYIVRYGWIAGPVDPLWSISVEEQFYIFIPWIVSRGSRRALFLWCGVLFASSYCAIVLYARQASKGDNGEWTNSLVHFQFFAAGTLLALGLRGRLPKIHVALRLAGVAGAFACWLYAFLWCGVKSWDAHSSVAGAIQGWLSLLVGCVVLFLSFLGTDGVYIPRWAVYLGKISYGLYVYHSLVLYLVFVKGSGRLTEVTRLLPLPQTARNSVGTAAALLITIVVAHLSYRFLEKPFLVLKQRFTFDLARVH